MYIVPIWEWMGLKKKKDHKSKVTFFSEKKISIFGLYYLYLSLFPTWTTTRKIILSNILMAVIVLSILLHGVEKTQKLG